AFYAPVLLICILAGAEGLIELLQQVLHLEVSRRLEGIVVAGQRQRHSEYRQEPSPAGVIDSGDILRELFHFEECRNGNRLFGLLINHHRGAYSAIGMASAGELSPIGIRTM